MTAFMNRKNKVVLSDYNYRRDIENRLLMANLSSVELEVLGEIINGSLKMTVQQLAKYLDKSEKDLKPLLTKLSQTKLFQLVDNDILTDKEMRKYYESQLIKFDDDFQPDMEFLQGLLAKVPIHVLPNWYQISKTSDNIFNSIIEKFFLTPKIYERHLSELAFDESLLTFMTVDIRNAKDAKIPSQFFIDKYKLSREQFEELMLQLEYNFVACLSYHRGENETWEEVISPFYEWREYLRFLRETTPTSITDPSKIKRNHPEDFGYLSDLNKLIEKLQISPMPIPLPKKAAFSECMIHKMEFLHLAEIHNKQLHLLEFSKDWLKMPLTEQALALYRHPANRFNIADTYSEKDIREVQKSIKRVGNCGWILFEDFKKGFIRPIANRDPVTLQAKGKRWKYTLPSYSESDYELIEKTIFSRLFETGMVATGTYEGQLCFCVTPFGRISLVD